eukprot:g15060.t1
MAPSNRLTCLVLLAAVTVDIAAATFVQRDALRKLTVEGETEFDVTGESGEEYEVEFLEEDGHDVEIVVMPESEEVPEETTITVVDGEIKTVMVGDDTYEVSYDSDGEVTDVTLVSGSATTRRTQQVVGEDLFSERRLQSCEDACEAQANGLCGALTFGCSIPGSVLEQLLGVLCDDVDSLCDVNGIVRGCERQCAPACTTDADCTEPNEVCCPAFLVCEVPDITGACGDPHMTGFLGQKFDFTGEDGEWYCLLDDGPSIHLNMRVTAPVPALPEITYITGLSLITADVEGVDHTVEITVNEPHNLHSSCPVGVSPCLANGALSVKLDGQESLVSPGEVTLGPGVAISAVNLPGACRSFGFEKYWEHKKVQNAGAGRKLDLVGFLRNMGEWILADPTATNIAECAQYVAAAGETGLFEHGSEHASFQIMTPTATIRLNHGKLHQLAMRDPTDQYDLPDHFSWQMNVAIDHHDVSLEATGVLGETVVPTVDANGKYIMKGMDAIRGSQQDYRVAGALKTAFALGHQ